MRHLIFLASASILCTQAMAEDMKCADDARAAFQKEMNGKSPMEIQALAAQLDEKLEACGVKVDGVHKKSRSLVTNDNLVPIPVPVVDESKYVQKKIHKDFNECRDDALKVYQDTKNSLVSNDKAGTGEAVRKAHEGYRQQLDKCHADFKIAKAAVKAPLTIQPISKHDEKEAAKEAEKAKQAAAIAADTSAPLEWWKTQDPDGLGPDSPGCGAQIGKFCKASRSAAAPGEKKNAFVACVVEHEKELTPKCRWRMTRKASRWVEQGKARMPASAVPAVQ